MKIYFAHPVSDYNTTKEKVDEREIKEKFEGCVILNPNGKVHSDKYKEEGMAYFEKIVKECDAAVCVPFRDGEWGMGVWREAESMAQKQGKTYELHKGCIKEVDFKDIRPLSINETKKRVKKETEENKEK